MVAVARRWGLRSALLLAVGAATLWVVPTGPASPLAARVWCGERSQTDRPDARSALQVHVVYAVPADGEDRFAQRVDGIVRDLTAVTEWWKGQDPTRTPRFDLAEGAACSTDLELARNGRLFLTTSELREIDSGLPGQTFSYGVRAVDGAGHLGPLRSLRFTIGLGVVNEAGVLVRDTVPPPQVTGFRAVRGRGSLTLRWSSVSDPGGLKGYRLTRNGRRHGGLVARPLRTVSLAGARARWSVSAVDRAGNVGDPATLRVSG